jgi:hypothetical protein
MEATSAGRAGKRSPPSSASFTVAPFDAITIRMVRRRTCMALTGGSERYLPPLDERTAAGVKTSLRVTKSLL